MKVTAGQVDQILIQLKKISNRCGLDSPFLVETIHVLDSAMWYAKFGNSKIIEYTYD